MKHIDIVDLYSVERRDRVRFGGKAVNLAALARAGFPVPEGFCISSGALLRFLEFNELLNPLEALLGRRSKSGEGLDEDLAVLRERIKSAPLEPEFELELGRVYRSLGQGRTDTVVAVRSSALSEDSAEASFAGQYDTVLNIRGIPALIVAIKAGWASYFSDRAVPYRCKRGLTTRTFDLGLVVQALIDASSSGVLFTANPLTGSKREMSLEGGFGMGEAFVSGQLCPDSFVLSRPFNAFIPGRPTIIHRQVVPKTRALRCAAGGSGALVLDSLPPESQNVPSLDDGQILALGRLGLKIERLFGCPQDIEWAIDPQGRIFVLQARPITGLVRRPHRRRDGILWTQRFSGERWTEPATTLGWSIIEPILHDFIYFEDAARRYLGASLPTRVIHSYPYFNITIFRHLLWKLPGFTAPQFILEFFPEDEQEELLAAPYVIPNLGLVATIFAQVFRERRWERYHWNFLTNHDAWEEFLPNFLEVIESLSDKPSSAREARTIVRSGQHWIREYIRIHLLSLLFANLYYQLLMSLLNRWLGEVSDQLLSEIVAEPDQNKTVETNHRLWDLAAMVREDEVLLTRFLSHEGTPTLAELEALPCGKAFVGALERFLEEHGHRSTASWEIFSPSWRDEPDLVIQMIRSVVQNDRNPAAEETARAEARERALARVLKRIGRWKPGRKALLLHVIESTRRYMTLRENQRYYFDMLLHKIKRALEALGDCLVEDGVLVSRTDLTLLTLPEVDEVLAGRLEGEQLATMIAERRVSHARDLEANHPVFVEGNGSRGSGPPLVGRRLSGLGISPGRITGTVRIIRQLKEMHKLRRGDILVTRATDPGWTPLFLTAGGLITELGSLLSHGAVVAREYNLPAVVNISHATSVLEDGQEITLDGTRGVVYLH